MAKSVTDKEYKEWVKLNCFKSNETKRRRFNKKLPVYLKRSNSIIKNSACNKKNKSSKLEAKCQETFEFIYSKNKSTLNREEYTSAFSSKYDKKESRKPQTWDIFKYKKEEFCDKYSTF